MNKILERTQPDPRRAEQEKSREELIDRVRARVKAGFYARGDVMKDVADALFHNPAAFENLP